MKKSIFGVSFFICLLGVTSCATVQTIGTDVEITTIYDDVNGPKNQLFLKANEWMISTFNNADSVIQYSDKEEGAIIGKYLMYGTLSVGKYTLDDRVFAILDVRVKENKVRISIKPAAPWNYVPKGYIASVGSSLTEEDFKKEAEKLMNSFHKALLVDAMTF